MAQASVEARRLTAAHRTAQGLVADRTRAHMGAVWHLLDLNHLDATAPRWLSIAVPLIAAQRLASSQVAARYMAAMRRLEVGSDATPHVEPSRLNVDAARTSLTVTGPSSIKAAMSRGDDLTEAATVAQSRTEAAGSRLALGGARDLILAVGAADDRAHGWDRITSGNACDFCESIAADGPFDFDAEFQAHDGCACMAAPIFG